MVIYVDIDNTICNTTGMDYENSWPIEDNIKYINSLYDYGHTIIYWTARGTITGINWEILTRQQLKKWNVKFHELKFGKPHYDCYIDDKVVNTKNLKDGINI
jgi:dTDP-glucose 4,6-dehydratase